VFNGVFQIFYISLNQTAFTSEQCEGRFVLESLYNTRRPAAASAD
jgi:hypothetical protein